MERPHNGGQAQIPKVFRFMMSAPSGPKPDSTNYMTSQTEVARGGSSMEAVQE